MLKSIHETNCRIKKDHEAARQRWRDGGEGATVSDEVDGVQVVMKYEGSSRQTDFRTVLFDGEHAAREAETIPWNILKSITTNYRVFLALSKSHTEKLIAGLPGKYGVVEVYYPPEDGRMYYDAECSTLEDAVALWKKLKNKS